LECRRLLSGVLRVDVNSPSPSPDGQSWATAFPDLQQALSVAGAGDEIWVADGTYKPASGSDRSASFVLKDRVSLLGGFAGYGAADPDHRDPTLFPTTLSGDIGTAGTRTDNSYQVLVAPFADAISRDTVIDGFTIADGYQNDPNSSSGGGAGISIDGGSPTISHCTFSNNAMIGLGGAVFMQRDAAPAFTDCIFIANTDIPNSPFFTFGGAVFADGSPAFLRCSFVRNSVVSRGGAVFLSGANATFTDCRFAGNVGGNGGAVSVEDGSTVNFANCLFAGNRATNRGGAIDTQNNGPGTTLINCTFASNEAAHISGAIASISAGNVTMANSIAWGNTAPQVPQLSNVTVSFSDVQGGIAGTGNINADPAFVHNPGRGADGVWGTADDDYGDLRLQMTSPCIDAGDNASVPPGITTDILGKPRFFDFPGVHDPGAIVDMGPYEQDLHLGLLLVPASQTLSLAPGGRTWVIEQLVVDSGGTLDVNDNDFIVDYVSVSQLVTIQWWIKAGRNGGTWSGAGITSSAAKNNPQHNTTLGAMEATDYKSIYGASATFNGEVIDTTAVLVKYTYYGDTDFNGRVNFDDYVRTDSGFSNHRSGWMNGDFDGNGRVNFDDYVLIDLAFNTQSGTLRRQGHAGTGP
jgi:hypothetical protein